MTTTIPLGDDLVFQGPGTTAFRMRINRDDGQLSILREDTSTGETWVVDTILRQNVPGFAFSRALIAEFFGLESNDPTLSGGALDTSTIALCRHVPGRTPIPYDAIWAIVAVGDDNAGGVKNQQYGALTFRILNPTPDANGHAQGEARLSGNGFAQQGWMGISNGAVLTDANGQNPLGGYMGFGTANAAHGYYVNGKRVDRQTVNFGTAEVVIPGQTRFYGDGYSASYPTGAYFLTTRAGYISNFTIRLPSQPQGTVTAVLQRQYADTGIQIALTGTAQQGFNGASLGFGAGEAIGVKLVLDGACVPQGGFKAALDFGA